LRTYHVVSPSIDVTNWSISSK